jgi:hypothetical protein
MYPTVCAALIVMFITACNPCRNKVVQELTSPDGKYVATAFIRDCGATTDYSPQVYLRKKGYRPAEIGNVFVGEHSENIQISWRSATELAIATDAEVVKQVISYENIKINITSNVKR